MRGQRNAQRDAVMQMIFKQRGLASQLAKRLKVSQQSISAWNRVPAHDVLEIAPLLKMTPEQIRPDIFGGRRGRRP